MYHCICKSSFVPRFQHILHFRSLDQIDSSNKTTHQPVIAFAPEAYLQDSNRSMEAYLVLHCEILKAKPPVILRNW